jgi:hypothetical protein
MIKTPRNYESSDTRHFESPLKLVVDSNVSISYSTNSCQTFITEIIKNVFHFSKRRIGQRADDR